MSAWPACYDPAITCHWDDQADGCPCLDEPEPRQPTVRTLPDIATYQAPAPPDGRGPREPP